MRIKQVVLTLRSIQEELAPFIRAIRPGEEIWNGTEYVIANEIIEPDPYALGWWATIMTMAEFLDLQDEELSEKQKAFLIKFLLGGMGSFQDFQLDKEKWGKTAIQANKAIEKKMNSLYKLLK